MNWWNLLWFLWPLSGLLMWGWAHHMLVQNGEDRPLKWVLLPELIICGPASLMILIPYAVLHTTPEHRWGLRFW